jgi:hypothetical protein
VQIIEAKLDRDGPFGKSADERTINSSGRVEANMSKKPDMTTRRSFIAATAVAAASMASIRSALAQPTPQSPGETDFLFVQSFEGLTFDKSTNKLTLTDVGPVMVFFTDCPERIAGNMKTAAFIPLWTQGKDSFKSNPPNADISLLEGKTLNQIVVELQDPVLTSDGDDLAYTVKVLQGEMLAKRCLRQAPYASLICRHCTTQTAGLVGILTSDRRERAH